MEATRNYIAAHIITVIMIVGIIALSSAFYVASTSEIRTTLIENHTSVSTLTKTSFSVETINLTSTQTHNETVTSLTSLVSTETSTITSTTTQTQQITDTSTQSVTTTVTSTTTSTSDSTIYYVDHIVTVELDIYPINLATPNLVPIYISACNVSAPVIYGGEIGGFTAYNTCELTLTIPSGYLFVTNSSIYNSVWTCNIGYCNTVSLAYELG